MDVATLSRILVFRHCHMEQDFDYSFGVKHKVPYLWIIFSLSKEVTENYKTCNCNYMSLILTRLPVMKRPSSIGFLYLQYCGTWNDVITPTTLFHFQSLLNHKKQFPDRLRSIKKIILVFLIILMNWMIFTTM